MKEFFEKFGFAEILSYLFPGAIALCSLTLWGRPSPEAILGEKLGSNQFVLAAILLIFAYASGLVVSMWSVSGAEKEPQLEQQPLSAGATAEEQRAFYFGILKWRLYRYTVRVPPPLDRLAWTGAFVELHDLLNGIYTVNSMELIVSKFSQLSVFRAIASDCLKEQGTTALVEAETFRRRVMFSLGVAFALLLLSISALLRLTGAILARVGPFTPYGGLLALGVMGAISAYVAVLIPNSAVKLRIVLLLVSIAAVAGVGFGVISAKLYPRGFIVLFLAIAVVNLIVAASKWRDPACVWPTLVLLAGTLASMFFANLFTWDRLWLDDLIAWDRKNAVPIPLLLIVVLCVPWISSRLRRVAAQCWEREVAHTLGVIRIFGHRF